MRFTKTMLRKMEIIADIGAQNASKYLSTMTNKKSRVSIPWVSSYPYEKVTRTAGNSQDLVTVVFMQMFGDIKGVILMVFPEKDAIEMADLLQGKTGTQELDQDGESALMEAGGNILANAYLNAFAEKLQIKITDSVPNIATDMLGSILDGVLGTFGAKSEETIVFKNRFKIGKKEILGNAYILFDPESFEFLFEKVRKCKIK